MSFFSSNRKNKQFGNSCNFISEYLKSTFCASDIHCVVTNIRYFDHLSMCVYRAMMSSRRPNRESGKRASTQKKRTTWEATSKPQSGNSLRVRRWRTVRRRNIRRLRLLFTKRNRSANSSHHYARLALQIKTLAVPGTISSLSLTHN